MGIPAVAFGLQVVGDLQADLQRSRLQRLQDQPPDQGIQGRTGERLTQRRPVVDRLAAADVAQSGSAVGVLRGHGEPAATADQATRQQRGTRTDHAAGLGGIGRELPQIVLVLVPGDIGRQVIFDQHLPLLRRRDRTPGRGASRLATAWIRGATSVDVGTGVDGVVQQVAQRHAVGATPIELAGARTAAHAIGQLDVMVDQITQNPVDRAAPLELPKHRLDHAPNLRVRILDHLLRMARGHSRAAAASAALRGGPSRACPRACAARGCAAPLPTSSPSVPTATGRCRSADHRSRRHPRSGY